MLLQYFKARVDAQGNLGQELTDCSYTVYIFHTPVLVLLTALLQGFELHPILRILLLAAPSLTLCFITASIFRRLPGLRAVLYSFSFYLISGNLSEVILN